MKFFEIECTTYKCILKRSDKIMQKPIKVATRQVNRQKNVFKINPKISEYTKKWMLNF